MLPTVMIGLALTTTHSPYVPERPYTGGRKGPVWEGAKPTPPSRALDEQVREAREDMSEAFLQGLKLFDYEIARRRAMGIPEKELQEILRLRAEFAGLTKDVKK